MFNKKEYKKQYQIKNREELKEYNRQYYIKNREEAKEYQKRCYKNNPEKAKQYSKQWRKNNPEKIKEYNKQYSKQWRKDNPEYQKRCYKNNPEKAKEYSKQWLKNNPEKAREYSKQWLKNNPEKARENHRKYMRLKSKIDLKFNLNKKMSTGIWQSLIGNKRGRHWETLVGYTLSDLVKQLNKTMPKGYTWRDYLNGELHIDHRIPISAFNFTKPEHIDFKRCWALSNLRLLPAKENIIKSNKLDRPFQPALAF